MLRTSRVLMTVLMSLGLAACSGSEPAVDPPYVEDFSVRLDEEELKTWDAIAKFSFYRDSGVGVGHGFSGRARADADFARVVAYLRAGAEAEL
jgi:hypothetical protein